MSVWVTVFIVLTGVAGFYVWKFRREIQINRYYLSQLLGSQDEMEEALTLGLYHMYKKKDEGNGNGKDPWLFEHFVRDVIVDLHQGTASVTPGSGDGGIDIIHTRHDGVHYGQVKCYAPNQQVDFSTIAILHSQIVKNNAAGGFVVTTSSFSEHAIQYARELDVPIELIDGKQFVKYWAQTIEDRKKSFPPFSADIPDPELM